MEMYRISMGGKPVIGGQKELQGRRTGNAFLNAWDELVCPVSRTARANVTTATLDIS